MPRADTATKKTAAKKAAAKPDPEALSEFAGKDEEESSSDWFVSIDDTVEFTNSLFYGREGSGKTTALARFANLAAATPHSKVLVINAEGGLKKVALQKRGVDTSRLVVWPDPKKGQIITRNGLEQVYRRVKADLMKDPASWLCTGWDSISEIHQAVLDHVQRDRITSVRNQGKQADDDFIDISDYGTMTKMVRDLLKKYRDLPCHFVVTALERRNIDKDTGKPQYGPAVTPGLATDLLGYVDFVLMFKAADEDGPYRALTRGNSRYRAKDRFDVLPRIMAEPMGDRIVQYVAGELTEDTDPFQDDLSEAAKTAQDKPSTPPAGDNDEEDETTEDA